MIRSLPSPVPASRWTSWITPLCVLGCRSTPPLPVACRKAALTSPKSTASVCLTGTKEQFARRLPTATGVQEEWNLYRITEFRNINNGDELLAWWESRPDSLFKEAVLFLITIPTSSGAVERFFSQAGNVSKQQNKLLNQMRRLAFMARFNLDVEGRLV